MIGLYCLLSSNLDDLNMVESGFNIYLDQYDDKFKVQIYRSSNAVIASILAPVFNKFNCFQSENYWIAIDGFVFDDLKRMSAEDVFWYVNKHGIKSIYEFDGEFVISIFLNNNFYLVSDRMGQRQYYKTLENNLILISPDPRFGSKIFNKKATLNKRAILAFILTNKLRLDKETMWTNTTVLERAISIQIIKSCIKFSTYWEMKYSPNYTFSQNECIERFIYKFKQAVNKRVINKCNMGITLTGGLDSRAMACALNVENRGKFIATTMGISNCNEIRIAEKVASILEINYQPFNIEPETVFKNNNLEYFQNEDCDQIIQALWKPYLSSLSNVDVLMHGLDLDVTFGGIYLTQELSDINNWNELVKYTIKESMSVSQELYERLFRNDLFKKFDFNPSYIIEQLLLKCKEDDLMNTYDNFIMTYSMFRVILQRYRAIRATMETISPMYDRKLLYLYLQIPPKMRMNYNIFQPFIKKIGPNVVNINYQRTSLPPIVPISLWKKSQELDKQYEELYREIAKNSKGKIYIPFKKYYTNVDEWLRFNKTWKKAIKYLISSKESVLRREWLNNSCIDKVLWEHLSHVKSNMKIIHLLLSAELFLRIDEGYCIKEITKGINSCEI